MVEFIMFILVSELFEFVTWDLEGGLPMVDIEIVWVNWLDDVSKLLLLLFLVLLLELTSCKQYIQFRFILLVLVRCKAIGSCMLLRH